MSPQSEGPLPTDRRTGDGAFGGRGTYRQPGQNMEDSQYTQGRANGYGQADGLKQRYVGPPPAPGDQRMQNDSNGSLPTSPIDGRNGRSRDTTTHDLPVRERSRTNGATGGKSPHPLRLCKKCGEPLTGQFVRALGGTFHLDCFKCRVR